MCKFDMEKYRQNSNLNYNLLNQTPQTQANMCYYMSPYSEFDIQSNPLVLILDWFGIFLVNISTSKVY